MNKFFLIPPHVSSERHSIDMAWVCNILLRMLVPFPSPGLTSEGIYRKSGVNSRVAQLLERFRCDARSVRLREGEHQVDDVSNALKRFFRELGEGLFTSKDASSWLSAAGKIPKTAFVPRSCVTLGFFYIRFEDKLRLLLPLQ